MMLKIVEDKVDQR